MAIALPRRRTPAPPVDQPVVEHLRELRRRLVLAIAAVAVAGVVGFVLYDRILAFLIEPYCGIAAERGRSCALYIQDPLEGFSTRLKVAGMTGLLLASPVVLFQFWRFVTPALDKREKRYAVPFVAVSVVLFCGGAAIAIATFPKALEFLVSVGGENLETIFSPAKYLRLVLFMVLAFGIAFEFPVVLVFLQLAGVLSSRRLRRARRPAIVGIVVAAAVITPSQDPYSLLALAGPMLVLYEASILTGRALHR